MSVDKNWGLAWGTDSESWDDEGLALGDQLVEDAKRNNLAEVVSLIDGQGVDVNHRNQNGSTAANCASNRNHLEVLRVLLAHGADPNIAAVDGSTPAMAACIGGHLEAVQLLAIHGADIKAVNCFGSTARSEAQYYGHAAVVAFMDATESWPPFRIAIGCRLHTDLKHMLTTGKIDPAGCCPLPVLMATATSTAELWPGQQKPCNATSTLARAAMAKWSPSTHWLHHERFREAIHTALLVVERLGRSPQPAVSKLPVMVWREVLGGLQRRDW